MDADGDFVAIWVRNLHDALFARRFDKTGRALGDEFQVAVDSYYGWAVEMAGAGSFAVAWSDYSGGFTVAPFTTFP